MTKLKNMNNKTQLSVVNVNTNIVIRPPKPHENKKVKVKEYKDFLLCMPSFFMLILLDMAFTMGPGWSFRVIFSS